MNISSVLTHLLLNNLLKDLRKLGLAGDACNVSSQEAEVYRHPQLHSEVKVSLGYVRPVLPLSASSAAQISIFQMWKQGTERPSSWVRPEFESRESGSTVCDPNQCAALFRLCKCLCEGSLIGKSSSSKGICLAGV